MFCRYCGNEVADNALICTKCGCLTSSAANGAVHNTWQNQAYAPQMPTPTVQAEQAVPAMPTAEDIAKKRTRKFFRLSKIFSGVSTGLTGLTAFFAFMFVALMEAAMDAGTMGGMAIAIFALFGLYGMFAVSPFALTTGILAFVFKKKSVEKTGAFPIVAFVLGIISFAVTILFAVLLCL